MTGRRILVTGAAGFLGRAAAIRFLGRGDVDRVIGVDLTPIDIDHPGFVGARRDVTDGVADLLEKHRIEVVLHHAYLIRPSRDPSAARRVNVEATEVLVSEAAASGVERIVYPSSTTVYGGWPDTQSHTEDEEPRPNPGFGYSEHKVESERVLAAAAAAGDLDAVVLRACVIAGPGARGFIFDTLGMRFLPVASGHDPPLQFLHVDDYLDAIEAAVSGPATGTFNLAGRGTIRVSEMAAMVGSRVVPVPGNLLRSLVRWTWRMHLQNRSPSSGLALIVHPWLADIGAAERELGWTPRWTSREAVAAWAESR